MIEDRYLGDGVYASCDGHMIVLDLRGQDSTTRISLEPEVFSELARFKKDFKGQSLTDRVIDDLRRDLKACLDALDDADTASAEKDKRITELEVENGDLHGEVESLLREIARNLHHASGKRPSTSVRGIRHD